MVEIRLPEISENVDSGDVVKVLVSEGDRVEVDQGLIELETEKAVFEVPATAAGVVAEIKVKVGDTVRVGDVIARIAPEGEVREEAPAEAEAAPAAPEAPAEAKAASQTVPAPPPVARAEPAPPPAPESAPPPAPDPVAAEAREEAPPDGDTPSRPAPASPTVRRLARELGIDIHRVPGSGPGGRISSQDVQQFAKSIILSAEAAPPVAGPAPAARELPDFSRFGDIERVPMSKVRRVTAANLAHAWSTVPAVTQNDKADVTDLEAARKRYALLAERAGGKLTMTAILLKVCAGALRRFADFNASIDVAHGEIIRKKYVHIGVAVDTERGLLVPVVRDVDAKNIVELSVELTQLAERARGRRLTPAEMEGASFTISNLGGIGGTGFSPIVNTPEVAILGVSRAAKRPVWRGEGFEPRLVMPLSLSYDHRLIDGAAAARFLRWVCEALENPILLALDS